MKITKKHGLSVICLVALLSGCVTTKQTSSKITNYETQGNLVSINKIGCLTSSELKNTYTPPDLYNGMVQCIKNGRDKDAAFLFALAGTYSTYDTLRVSDATAHQAHSVLAMRAREAVEPSEYQRFFEVVKSTLGDPGKLPGVCREINSIGAPNYQPMYMVQHGMSAFIGANSGSGLVGHFNSTSAWRKSLESYLHCPNI